MLWDILDYWLLAIDFCYSHFFYLHILFKKDTKIKKRMKYSDKTIPLLSFEDGPGVPLLNFKVLGSWSNFYTMSIWPKWVKGFVSQSAVALIWKWCWLIHSTFFPSCYTCCTNIKLRFNIIAVYGLQSKSFSFLF